MNKFWLNLKGTSFRNINISQTSFICFSPRIQLAKRSPSKTVMKSRSNTFNLDHSIKNWYHLRFVDKQYVCRMLLSEDSINISTYSIDFSSCYKYCTLIRTCYGCDVAINSSSFCKVSLYLIFNFIF